MNLHKKIHCINKKNNNNKISDDRSVPDPNMHTYFSAEIHSFIPFNSGRKAHKTIGKSNYIKIHQHKNTERQTENTGMQELFFYFLTGGGQNNESHILRRPP